jgi:hypothetical protein
MFADHCLGRIHVIQRDKVFSLSRYDRKQLEWYMCICTWDEENNRTMLPIDRLFIVERLNTISGWTEYKVISGCVCRTHSERSTSIRIRTYQSRFVRLLNNSLFILFCVDDWHRILYHWRQHSFQVWIVKNVFYLNCHHDWIYNRLFIVIGHACPIIIFVVNNWNCPMFVDGVFSSKILVGKARFVCFVFHWTWNLIDICWTCPCINKNISRVHWFDRIIDDIPMIVHETQSNLTRT